MAKRRNTLVLTAVGLALTAVVVVLITVLSGGHGQGPLHRNPDAAFISQGNVNMSPGGLVAVTIHGMLGGNRNAVVESVRLLSVAGFPTPTLERTARLTGRGEGVTHPWPRPDDLTFERVALVGKPFAPTRRFRILAGLRLGHRPGLYAAGGAVVTYSVGGREFTTHLYDCVYGCVPGKGSSCSDAVVQRAIDRAERAAGLR